MRLVGLVTSNVINNGVIKAKLNASSTNNSNGGFVSVWVDNTVNTSGTIAASGGPNGGDGGYISINAGQQLNNDGTNDVSAPNGNPRTVITSP